MLQPAATMRKTFDSTLALGDKLVLSDGLFVPEGFGDIKFLIKQFPTPVPTAGDFVEVPLAFGMLTYQPGQLKVGQQGAIGIQETVRGTARVFLREVLARGGFFNARIYEGTEDKFAYMYYIERVCSNMEPVDRDNESRTQVMTYTGQVGFNYFGDRDKEGNI